MSEKPWENEPDHVLFMSEAGYVCEIKRHPRYLHLNGYIYIPKGHPDYGKGYDELHEHDVPRVHGGWTYSEIDEQAGVTVFGFDCNHLDDLSPGMAPWGVVDQTYRDIAYVTNELERAARQFKERSKK